ncbi:MAG TPA: class I SAM-dependent methyltransferase [Stackebrandtia sp.]|uniref:class I SAM-dependent methyltransferase n=1 Tax=Stackebrandtia sp. TaxID=2023065 RepID=UPI002D5131F8|nr:class I SAM-dependent methyltransferase [Stackebrandtia sp.]HZE38311.1 class I SAM-dependent methyltransferase [Stackebrandtia sp.]
MPNYEDVKDALRIAYDNDADARDAMADAAWKRSEREDFAALLRMAAASTLLEIGAGHGVGGRFFADEGLAVTCVDLSPELVERCRAKGLDARVMDFSNPDFEDVSFDAVFGMNTLLHVPRAELEGILRSVRRVLKPSGLFYWGQYGGRESEGVYDGDSCEPKRFFSFMTDERIQRIASSIFDVVDFHVVPQGDDDFHYQALTLRRG